MAKLGTDAIIKGVAASRPAAGVNGRLYWASDTKALSRDNASTWDTIIPAVSAGGSLLAVDGSGDLAFTGDFTVGDTFPGSPADGDKHQRTDLGQGYVWDDTLSYWLGPEFQFHSQFTVDPHAADVTIDVALIPAVTSMYITRIQVFTLVGTTNDSLNDWALSVSTAGGRGALLNTLSSIPALTGPDAYKRAEFVPADFSFVPLIVDTDLFLEFDVAINGGTPGVILAGWIVYAQPAIAP